ncbi:DUF551 domain-containing protein [Raoultella ornithinolytica]|nr:DUF551 domain-containing protein [Raoultella ornithinolytica]
MSILTKEGIQKILNDDWLLMDDCEGLENCTVIKELARMALAAMDSEPVAGEARFKEERPRWTPCTAEHVSMVLANPEDWPNYEVRYLYAAPQPAPVVPEEMPTYAISPYSGAEYEAGYRDGWNACRAAMLQAGNSPVIPDGYRLQPISEYEAMCATVNSDEWPQRWIPVSERMPEDRTQVILWDAEIGEVTSGHYSHKTHTFYHCGDAIQNEITHWMPLPAAPQEVNRE